MPLAIIVMVVLTLLGTALWHYSMTDVKHIAMEESRMQAYYLARSGAELLWAMGETDGVYTIELDNTHVINITANGVDGIITYSAEVNNVQVTFMLEEETEHWRN